MKKRKRNKNGTSASELLSDLSFSTLGLVLIVFVVYSILFNSNVPYRQVVELKSKVEELELKTEVLQAEKVELSQQNQRLRSQKDEVAEKLRNVEQKIRRIEQQNRYTGYYAGDYKGKLLYNCQGDNYSVIRGNQSISYFQEAGIMVHSMSVKNYGTITFKYKGSLNGSVFTGSSIEYSRGEEIVSCDTKPKIQVEFKSDSLSFEGDFGTQTLRKVE